MRPHLLNSRDECAAPVLRTRTIVKDMQLWQICIIFKNLFKSSLYSVCSSSQICSRPARNGCCTSLSGPWITQRQRICQTSKWRPKWLWVLFWEKHPPSKITERLLSTISVPKKSSLWWVFSSFYQNWKLLRVFIWNRDYRDLKWHSWILPVAKFGWVLLAIKIF